MRIDALGHGQCQRGVAVRRVFWLADGDRSDHEAEAPRRASAARGEPAAGLAAFFLVAGKRTLHSVQSAAHGPADAMEL
jgi:hypothetical protein